MNKPIIYLAGPIEVVTKEESAEWRLKCILRLQRHYEILNPCAWSHEYKDEDSGLIFDAEGMVKRDMSAIDKSDILIVNVDNHGWGTASELTYAYMMGKGTYVYGKHSTHPFVQHHTSHPFENLDEIIEHLLK